MQTENTISNMFTSKAGSGLEYISPISRYVPTVAGISIQKSIQTQKVSRDYGYTQISVPKVASILDYNTGYKQITVPKVASILDFNTGTKQLQLQKSDILQVQKQEQTQLQVQKLEQQQMQEQKMSYAQVSILKTPNIVTPVPIIPTLPKMGRVNQGYATPSLFGIKRYRRKFNIPDPLQVIGGGNIFGSKRATSKGKHKSVLKMKTNILRRKK